MFCNNCGTEQPEGTKFCSSCGAPISGAAQPASPVQPTTTTGYSYGAPAAPQTNQTQPFSAPQYDPNYNANQPKKKSKLPLIIGIVVAVVVVAVIAGIALGGSGSSSSGGSATVSNPNSSATVSSGDSSNSATNTSTPVETPATSTVSSADITGSWTVAAVSNDGGDNFVETTSSLATINADGTCSLNLEGEALDLQWSQGDYDGEGYFYSFSIEGTEIMMAYVYDSDPNTMVMMMVSDTNYVLGLSR